MVFYGGKKENIFTLVVGLALKSFNKSFFS